MDTFLCWSMKTATYAVTYYTIIFGCPAALFEILDIAAVSDSKFEIAGGFKSSWRAHVWEGWLACNIVMLLFHIIMIGYSGLMIYAIKKLPTFYEFNMTKAYMVLFVIFILVELGISLYRFSWYGPNIFRLGYLVFIFMYWILRTIINTFAVCVIYSRICEMDYEITYGEKKDATGLVSSRGKTIENPFLSGAATPVTMKA